MAFQSVNPDGSVRNRLDLLPRVIYHQNEGKGGSLSPDWVELLMGWPQGWTSLEPLPALGEWGSWPATWEDGIPRTLTKVPQRIQRLKAIGNGQVPACAAAAWRILEVTQ